MNKTPPEFRDYVRCNLGFNYTKDQLRMTMWNYMEKYNVMLVDKK